MTVRDHLYLAQVGYKLYLVHRSEIQMPYELKPLCDRPPVLNRMAVNRLAGFVAIERPLSPAPEPIMGDVT
jgi:hypothetical protein